MEDVKVKTAKVEKKLYIPPEELNKIDRLILYAYKAGLIEKPTFSSFVAWSISVSRWYLEQIAKQRRGLR